MKALAERVLNAEMDHHLVNGEPGNSRNGYPQRRFRRCKQRRMVTLDSRQE
jgi:transposase-like protein